MSFDATKVRLIVNAEKMLAERGLDAVSLREITIASGERNASALNYHFGSRQGLIRAISAYRMGAIDARRHELLSAVEAEGRTGDLRSLIEVKTWPQAESMVDDSGSNNYVRLMAQIHARPNVDFRDIVADVFDQTFTTVNQYILDILAHLPDRVVRQRLRIMPAQTAIALSEADRMRRLAETSGDGNRFNLELAVENIIDMQVGAVSAPVSARLAAKLAEDEKPRRQTAT